MCLNYIEFKKPAGGPDGLSHQHLVDLTSFSTSQNGRALYIYILLYILLSLTLSLLATLLPMLVASQQGQRSHNDCCRMHTLLFDS